MIDNLELPEEELVRLAADVPSLPGALRRRVIDSAVAARRRQSTRRAAMSMVCLLGVAFGGAYAALQDAASEISSHAGFAARSRTYDRHSQRPMLDRAAAIEFVFEPEEMIVMAGTAGEWGQVDAFFMLRELRSMAIRGTL
jgi:hypothetical protein